jgi:hypothetical protein
MWGEIVRLDLSPLGNNICPATIIAFEHAEPTGAEIVPSFAGGVLRCYSIELSARILAGTTMEFSTDNR